MIKKGVYNAYSFGKYVLWLFLADDCYFTDVVMDLFVFIHYTNFIDKTSDWTLFLILPSHGLE